MCWVAQSYLTLCDLMYCSPSDSSPHGVSSDNNNGLSCHALLQGSSQSRGETQVSCIAGRFFIVWAIFSFIYTRHIYKTHIYIQDTHIYIIFTCINIYLYKFVLYYITCLVYICVCVCIYIYIYVYIYIYIYKFFLYYYIGICPLLQWLFLRLCFASCFSYSKGTMDKKWGQVIAV